MGRLLLVRHGRTAWNRSRFLGRADVPLDEIGEAQARAVARVLGSEPLDAVFCSPLQRAIRTAAPLAEAQGLALLVRDELSELDCGQWQGTLKSDPSAKISKRDPELPLPGGESVADAWRRVTAFASDNADALARGCSVVVGHYLVNQLLVGVLVGGQLRDALRSPAYRPAPGSVLELRFEQGRWQRYGFRLTALASAL